MYAVSASLINLTNLTAPIDPVVPISPAITISIEARERESDRGARNEVLFLQCFVSS
jgi:hypothetical protein